MEAPQISAALFIFGAVPKRSVANKTEIWYNGGMKIIKILRIASRIAIELGALAALVCCDYIFSHNSDVPRNCVVAFRWVIVFLAGIIFLGHNSRLLLKLPFGKKYLSLFRFWLMYTKKWQIALAFIGSAATVFTIALTLTELQTFPFRKLLTLIRKFPESCKELLPLFVMLSSSVISALTMPWKTIYELMVWKSKKSIKNYNERPSTKMLTDLNKRLLQIGCTPGEAEWGALDWLIPEKDQEGLKIGDTIFWSSKINARLISGAPLYCSIKKHRDCQLYKNLSDDRNLFKIAWEVLHLKQKAVGARKFFNENKINLVGFSCPEEKVLLKMEVAKSCYYASYVTTEFYRDAIYDARFEGRYMELNLACEKDADASDQKRFLPYIRVNTNNDTRLWLPDLDGRVSEHIGVNTIAITKDGHAIILQQNMDNAIYSGELAAPTASGSMDWEDIEEANAEIEVEEDGSKRKVIDFRKVIQYSAERELSEEASIARKKKLNPQVGKMQLKREQIDTKVLGMYRWGSRGGLPGFLCITRIDEVYDKLKTKLAQGDEANVNESLNTLKFKMVDDKAGREYDVNAIVKYIQDRYSKFPMSLPLHANLLALRDAIANDENFWKNHGF